MVKLTIATLLVVVGLVAASIGVALYVLDDEDYLDIAKLALQETLEWTLEVRGPISLDRSLTFALTGHDAVLTRGKTKLAAAKQAIFRLELLSLLRGQFRFEVEVNKPNVRFVIDIAGRTSWNFEQIAEPGGGFPLETVIGGIKLGKGQTSIRDESSGTVLTLNLNEIEFKEKLIIIRLASLLPVPTTVMNSGHLEVAASILSPIRFSQTLLSNCGKAGISLYPRLLYPRPGVGRIPRKSWCCG